MIVCKDRISRHHPAFELTASGQRWGGDASGHFTVVLKISQLAYDPFSVLGSATFVPQDK
jgi:hypothetical protein